MKMYLLLFMLIVSCTLFAQDSTKKMGDESKMKQYFMVFLYRGEAWTPERTPETEQLQAGHLANITKLAQDGKILLAGPFADNTPLRGIFIFDVSTQEEVAGLCDTDPAIKAKRLRYEIKPWYGPKALDLVNKAYFNK